MRTIHFLLLGFLVSKTFSAFGQTPASAANLRITEVNYHPHPLTAAEESVLGASASEDDFEFIEVRNISAVPITLFNCTLTIGLNSFVITDNLPLAPNANALFVKDASAFSVRYGVGHRIMVDYSGKLSNNSELIALTAANGTTIQSFTYWDSGKWPGRADGNGATLEAIHLDGDYNDPANWRSSREYGGTPSSAGTGPVVSVVINEILNHSDPPYMDFVELHNTTGTPIAIGNWILTDSLGKSNIARYRIPAGTIIQPNQYLTFTAANFASFNPLNPLGLSEFGESLYLLEANLSKPLAFVDDVKFGPAETNVSQGRVYNSVGKKDFTHLSAITMSTMNSGPLVGPVIFSEIMYHPQGAGLEFLEIKNISATTVALAESSAATNRYWRIDDAVQFQFADGDALLPGEYALICSTNPPVFRALYNIPDDIKVFGPYVGALNNSGETVRLYRPGKYDLHLGGHPTVLVEKVEYDDDPPWPIAADGTGPSLERLVDTAYGNDPANWITRNAMGSPGGPSQIDSDGDGLPDNLEYALFKSIAHNDFATADRDHDGMRDLDEYLLGTPILTSNETFRVELAPNAAGDWILAFPSVQSSGPGYYGTSRKYAIQTASALGSIEGSWADIPSAASIPATGSRMEIPLPPPASNEFLRVRARIE